MWCRCKKGSTREPFVEILKRRSGKNYFI